MIFTWFYLTTLQSIKESETTTYLQASPSQKVLWNISQSLARAYNHQAHCGVSQKNHGKVKDSHCAVFEI
jgi:hypothetical protein